MLRKIPTQSLQCLEEEQLRWAPRFVQGTFVLPAQEVVVFVDLAAQPIYQAVELPGVVAVAVGPIHWKPKTKGVGVKFAERPVPDLLQRKNQ